MRPLFAWSGPLFLVAGAEFFHDTSCRVLLSPNRARKIFVVRTNRHAILSGYFYFIPFILGAIGIALVCYFGDQVNRAYAEPRKYCDLTDTIEVSNPLKFKVCFDGEVKFRRNMRQTAAFTFTNVETGEVTEGQKMREPDSYPAVPSYYGFMLRHDFYDMTFNGRTVAIVELKKAGTYAVAYTGIANVDGLKGMAAYEILPDATFSVTMLIVSCLFVISGAAIPAYVIYRKRRSALLAPSDSLSDEYRSKILRIAAAAVFLLVTFLEFSKFSDDNIAVTLLKIFLSMLVLVLCMASVMNNPQDS